MARSLAWTAAATVCGLALGVALGRSATPLAPGGRHGFDVSWPQCSGSAAGHMPAGRPPYLILGLTNGVDGTANPCVGSQLSWARSRGVRVGAYFVASYPNRARRRLAGDGPYGECGTSQRCRLRNDGAEQARAALATMQSAGLRAPIVWIDVEVRQVLPWSHHRAANAAVIQGIVHGLRAAHVAFGVYTTAFMWSHINGGYRLGVPNWLPSGNGEPASARAMCNTTATGGVTWLVQYTRSLDSDLTCPVLDPIPLPKVVSPS